MTPLVASELTIRLRGRTLRFCTTVLMMNSKKALYALGEPPLPPFHPSSGRTGRRRTFPDYLRQNEGAVTVPAAGLHFQPWAYRNVWKSKALISPSLPCTHWATSATSTWKIWPSIKWILNRCSSTQKPAASSTEAKDRGNKGMCHRYYRDALPLKQLWVQTAIWKSSKDGPTSLFSLLTTSQ